MDPKWEKKEGKAKEHQGKDSDGSSHTKSGWYDWGLYPDQDEEKASRREVLIEVS